jgi:hypothetical protein
MCDYSLELVASRPAAAGQQLVVTRFPPFMTRGFAEIRNPGVAICLLPGTEVAFEAEGKAEPKFPWLPKRGIGERLARFRQVDLEKPMAHHDALEFANGDIVLINRLILGQIATVLQLPCAREAAEITMRAQGVPAADDRTQKDVVRSG